MPVLANPKVLVKEIEIMNDKEISALKATEPAALQIDGGAVALYNVAVADFVTLSPALP